MLCLNVAEKPSVAKAISDILGQGRKNTRPGVSKYNPIFEFSCQINSKRTDMRVTSLLGHLMHFDFVDPYKNWNSCPPVDLFDCPINKLIKTEHADVKKNILKELRGCDTLILWLDCDREGENIAYEVVGICLEKRPGLSIKRAHFSSLTSQDIFRAINTLSPPNKHLSDAVDVRSEIDLRIGAAFTRFQTRRIQRKFTQLREEMVSFGPCQFPTLGFVVERFLEVEKFESSPFWLIRVSEHRGSHDVVFKWDRNHLFDRQTVCALLALIVAKPVYEVCNVSRNKKTKYRPLPLTTVSLQKAASRKLQITSDQTMTLAEKLYQAGLISYPRTETDQFEESIDLKALLATQTNHPVWGNYAQSLLKGGKFLTPRKGSHNDNSHPPIHPTQSPSSSKAPLEGKEAALYEYITRHFLACCSGDALANETRVSIQFAELTENESPHYCERFSTSGLHIVEANYLDIFIYEKWNAKFIPEFMVGERARPDRIVLEEGKTLPPELLTEADLISLMDKNGIGTDATIAQHIKKIQDRQYCAKHNGLHFAPTELGIALFNGYKSIPFDNNVSLTKPELRAEMERDMNRITTGELSKDQVLAKALGMYKQLFITFSNEIERLDEALLTYFQPLTLENRLGTMSTRRLQFSICGRCNALASWKKEKTHNFLFCKQCDLLLELPLGTPTPLPTSRCKNNNCNFQVLEIISPKKKTYKICPYCYHHPPESGDSKSNATFPCFQCRNFECPHVTASIPIRPCKCSPRVLSMILRKRFNPSTDRTHFYCSCSKYPKCQESYFLPRNILEITISRKLCQGCNLSRLLSITMDSPDRPTLSDVCLFGCHKEMREKIIASNYSKQVFLFGS